eukprot:CAMPEP_0113499288 /NCGR_PEP_ID=MMETSP0014_2-20120614/31664_1 /TAXON_ID=2857 /ORGANISM="Nitzschia sp." /LENGTH=586 /DNA_ID=CAMNT_0000393445 /DNA_START=51 /DNA_END=1808 /DNA_ORIENTATION=- /assembly_acc=CAM_ASM_000159
MTLLLMASNKVSAFVPSATTTNVGISATTQTPAFLVAPTTTRRSRRRSVNLYATIEGAPTTTTSSSSSSSPSSSDDGGQNDNFNPQLLDDMQTCLQMLQTRADNGLGSLSNDEVTTFDNAMSRVFDDMMTIQPQSQQEQGQQPSSTTSVAETPSSSAPPAMIPQHHFEVVPPASDDIDMEEPSQKQSHQEEQQSTTKPSIEVTPEDEYQLRIAVSNFDVDTVTTLIDAGLEMDEATTDTAFWEVVKAVDKAEENNEPLSGNVPKMLHRIFEADLKHLQTREKITKNVTCMQPDESQGMAARAQRMSYIFDDSSHKDLPLTEGRVCEGGNCCDKCSRNIFPTFATDAESSLTKFPELCSLTFNELETVSTSTILQFVRLVERVRRTISYEYGVPLSTILPLQAYSRKYVAGTTQKGGGGGEGDFVTLHTDEATHSGYHYSCVLYLSTQGVDFEGGNFVFNDPAPGDAQKRDEEDDEYEMDMMTLVEEIRRAGRELTPFHPTRGAAVIFSSGWENMHEVEKITSGVRYAVPCFFTTCPVPEAAYEQMTVGKPKTDEDIADDWLHLLLAHRKEEPMESVGRVKELLMKW